jgi:hypothetical protein
MEIVSRPQPWAEGEEERDDRDAQVSDGGTREDVF